MHNNLPHFRTSFYKRKAFYAVCYFTLMSSTAVAQTTPAQLIFPEVPQIANSDAALAPIETPQENNQAAQETASNVEGVAATAKPVNTRPPSYGDWSKSLMFPEKEIKYMKTILDEYEATGEVPLSLQDIPDVVEIIEEPKIEITEYPSFHLKTILYHSPKYWGVWINDIKITSRDNNDGEAEIKVINISKEIVRFEWKPSDPRFMKEFTRQLPDLKAVADDTVLPIINRTSRSARSATISDDNTTLYFSLRLNESFSTETFYTFDGKPPTLTYPSLDIPYSVDKNAPSGTAVIAPDVIDNAEKPSETILKDNTIKPDAGKNKNIANQQSPKKLLESITPEAALEALTPEQAIKAIEAITKE